MLQVPLFVSMSSEMESTAQQISETANDISLLKKALNEQDESIAEVSILMINYF